MRLRYLLLALLVVSTAAGCSDESVSPEGDPLVVLNLDLADDTAGQARVVTARATVRHLGGPNVTYMEPCAISTVYFQIIDSQGNEVRFVDPCGPIPLCPAVRVELRRGDGFTDELRINGRVWSEDCEEMNLMPGRYTVVATFRYGRGADSVVLEQKGTFVW